MSATTVNLGIGVRGFYYADVNSDNWVRVENIVEGSLAFTFTDPTETPLNVEDKADPIALLRTKDTPDRIDLSFYNLSAAEIAVLTGGSATGEKYSSPLTVQNITKRIRIVTEPYNSYYIIYTLENAQLLGKPAGAPTKKQAEQFNVSCVVQAAANLSGTSIAPYTREACHEYVPYNLIVDDTANTLAFTIMKTGSVLGDYEYSSTIGGAGTWVPVTTNPITGLTGEIAQAALGIRCEIGISTPQKATAVPDKGFTA